MQLEKVILPITVKRVAISTREEISVEKGNGYMQRGKGHIQNGKKGILRLVFSRTAFIVLLLIFQIVILVIPLLRIQNYSTYYYIGFTLLAAILVIYIINKQGNPTGKLAWMIPVLVFPVFGSVLYLFVEFQFGATWINRRLRTLATETKQYARQNEEVMKELESDSPYVARLTEYVENQGGFPIYKNSSVKYLPSGEEKFEEMKIQLEKAHHFIFLEYFIVEDGDMWGAILEILNRKVKEGVEVRFMYDGMCSLVLLPYKYPKKINAMGIQCKVFSPIKPALSTHQNNRDHRKVLVIDGHTAFTGGINMADEYINSKERFGYWKDTAIMIKGEAVKSFTLMFLQMWNIDTKEADNYQKYLNIPAMELGNPEDGYVMPYADSPVDKENIGENVYLDILYTAKKYVHIMTPYLILDYEFIVALTYAAKRGIDVTIIMPGIPDKWYAFVVAKTYYKELIGAGVSIYEYTPGFIHAKVFTSDDEKAVVGTINLDYRSFYLHFECAAYMYKNREVAHIEQDFQETLAQCKKMEANEYQNLNIFFQLAGRILRIFAPLM